MLLIASNLVVTAIITTVKINDRSDEARVALKFSASTSYHYLQPVYIVGPRGFGKTLKCFKRGWPVSVQIDPIVVIYYFSVCVLAHKYS
jgi:hypothetical protein